MIYVLFCIQREFSPLFVCEALFDSIAKVEQEHEASYLALLEHVKSGTVFTSEEATTQWECRYCGYIHTGKSAPKACPECHKPHGFFQRKQENY